jgi:erythromycin esterase-like protein
MRLILTLVFFLGSLSLLPSPAQQISKDSPTSPSLESLVPTEKPFVDWARKNAVPLKTVEAGSGFADMRPIGSIVDDARIVALGEATHGTREFFRLKHRILEYLATQKGFTIFAIEANMPEAYRLNDFVLQGDGDPKQHLKGMYFWTWNTQEVLDMILWMREFNRSGKGHIEFTGFDMQTPNESIRTVSNFAAIQDSAYAPVVERTYADILKLANSIKDGPGILKGKLPIHAAAGKRVTFSGYIRTEAVAEGYAGLWMRIEGPNVSTLAFDNMSDRGPKGSTQWAHYQISFDVPSNATGLNFGVLHTGTGKAWFDSLKIEIDGLNYDGSNDFDFDFESESPRGFQIFGGRHQLVTDKSVAHTGKQSLLSLAVDHPPSLNRSLSNLMLVESCRKVLNHFEDQRSTLLREGISSESVDWVIQNARLVLQYAQMQAETQSRDQSMAENLKWIADHCHGGKVVVWAHNGHVAYGRTGSFVPMGYYLRQMFGKEFVNFGFAFNEGSFRALEIGKELREFSVAPTADGTLDHALAATGLPIFALDLRELPTRGPVADWISHPHPSRSIGAVYNESNPDSFMWDVRAPKVFDAILFVEKTSASVGISGTILK